MGISRHSRTVGLAGLVSLLALATPGAAQTQVDSLSSLLVQQACSAMVGSMVITHIDETKGHEPTILPSQEPSSFDSACDIMLTEWRTHMGATLPQDPGSSARFKSYAPTADRN